MKTLILSTVTWLTLAGWLNAGPADQPYQGSAEFERMKSLAGVWKGKADMGQGLMEITVEYRLVAGGSAVEERLFAGTPKEMLTVYHDQQGKLALTHYCMLHNRPSMQLKSADKQTLKFDFDAACGIDAKSETHMHSLVLTFVDPDTITHNWKLFEGGKAKDDHAFTFKRVKT